jgi:hypothetical protein
VRMDSLGGCGLAGAKYFILGNSHGFPFTIFQI